MTAILAFDTAASACSAALWRDGAVRARRFAIMERGQAEALLPMIEEVMEEAAARFADLDALAVTVGPGSFTGLRVGLAAARGMALAAGLPCLGASTLEAVVHGTPEGEREAGAPFLAVLETKRADVYAQAFAPDLEPLGDAGAVMPEDLGGLFPPGPVFLVGDAAGCAAAALAEKGIKATLSSAAPLPDAAVVAGMAAGKFRAGAAVTPPAPLYLRSPDARPAGKDARLRP